MKIEKIILRNFSAVKNAMETNEITIDFSSSCNKICLIIGPNGSGKTTLMSLFNPFAGLGNLDVRDGNDLILEDKEGYKEIHISDDENYYIIKHFYFPHKGKSHSVKSYIMKNDNELNENGNVTSFKEFVRLELGIEPDYLKLIRLGSNVTSMIDLSETERKNFMSKLLDEIGIYLTYYKKINTDLHQLKDMISHNIDKLNRLNIEDKKIVKDLITRLQVELESEQTRYGEISGNISIYKRDINLIENGETLHDRLSTSLKKLNKMNKILENKDDLESTEVSYYSDKINTIEKQLLINNTEISSSKILIKSYLDALNQCQEQLRILMIQYDKEQESDKELKGITEEHRKITLEIKKREDNLGHFSISYTKKQFDDFIVFLKNTQQTLNRTYEFGKKPIKKVMDLLKDNRNVMNYINSHIMNVNDDQDEHDLFFESLIRRFDFDKNQFETCLDESCQARALFNQIKNLVQNRDSESNKEDLNFYRDMEYSYNNIKSILSSFATYKDIIIQLPDDIKNWFLTETLYDNIANLNSIYDEKQLNSLLSMVTEYDDYLRLCEIKDKLEIDIERFKHLSTFSYVSDQVDTINNSIQEYQDKISKLKNRISELNETNLEYARTVESLYELKETFEKYDELTNTCAQLQKEYDSYKNNMELLHKSEIELYKCKINMDDINLKIQRNSLALSQYIELKDELKKYNFIYDEMLLTKEAYSSKKGMSLYYIKNYLGNTEEITNELLDIAYDGKIYIDKFQITPTEFTIPFINKGKRIRDVKYASQGELSFLSIALSFGLASQSLGKYNIMLLDEIDGPLDTKNREKFISILENQIERIGSEQNFLITHNDMFSSYPVDIIDLGFNTDKDDYQSKYELANYIKITRK